MSEPEADTTPEISLRDALRLPKRHPACRRREAQSGSCTERENLAGDAKGKGASGSNREAETTDAPERGALPRSSNEAGQCPRSKASRSSPLSIRQLRYTGMRPNVQRQAASFALWH